MTYLSARNEVSKPSAKRATPHYIAVQISRLACIVTRLDKRVHFVGTSRIVIQFGLMNDETGNATNLRNGIGNHILTVAQTI